MQQINLKIGNVLEKIKLIPDNSIDCIVTSCPYYGLRKYKAPDVVLGGEPNCEHEFISQEVYKDNLRFRDPSHKASVGNNKNQEIYSDPNTKANVCLKCSAWKGQLGLEPDYRTYLNHMLKVTAELKRVLKPTGTLWWNIGTSYNDKADMQLPTRLSIRMADEQGWLLRNTLIWHKRNHMPSSVKDRLSNSYEFIFFFTKQKRYFFNLDSVRVPVKFPEDVARRMYQDKQANVNPFNKGTDAARHTKQDIMAHNRTCTYSDPLHTKPLNPLGKNPGDVLELTTQPFKGAHFAVFPPKLPEFCIKAGSPEEVCSACGKPIVSIIE